MSAVWFLLRARFRQQWRGWVGVALLGGVIGGAVIATLAGARRTETSYQRFVEATHAFDIALTNGGGSPGSINRQFKFDEIARLPEVADAALSYYYEPSGTTASGRAIEASELSPLASVDGKLGTSLNKARVLHGRLPRGDGELAITPVVADVLGVTVGEVLHLQLRSPRGTSPSGTSPPVTNDFRIVGEVAMQTGFPPVTGGLPPIVLLSDTYARTHPDGAEVFAVRLHGGARAIPSFEAALARRAGGQPVITASKTEFNAVERSLSVQSTVLRSASLFAGLAALLVVGPLFVRQAVFASADDTSLRALGATRAQLRGVGIGAGIAVGIGAAVTAFVLAVGLSALTPIGIARNIEPHPGVVVNVAYVGVGVFVVFLVSAALAAGAAWLAVGAVRAPSIATRASGVSKLLERARLSPPAGAGARMALVPGGRGAGLPAVATIFGATFSVAMIVGVIVFSASLARLFDHPQQYGWNWDIQIGDSFSPSLEQHAIDLAANPVVAAVAGGTTARVEIGGRLVDALAIKPQRGAVEPVVVAGRAPSAPDEVLLGTRTLHDVHANIGDEVSLGVGDRSERFVVVGRGVLPEFAGAARLGEGATVTFDGMRRVVPDAVPNVVLVRVRPGSGGRALVVDLTKARAGNIYLPAKPSDLSQLGRGGDLSALAAILAAMGVTTLAYALVSSVRRRRRELAILKVLGFSRRQVSATVAWQATVIAGVAIVVGVPLGAVAGQWSWRVFANQLGVVPRGAIPLVALGVVVLGALVLANLTAALPARNAGRTRPTVALHAE